MRRIQADLEVEGGWETWILEVAEDWVPEDGLADVEFVMMKDAGNDSLAIDTTSVVELD